MFQYFASLTRPRVILWCYFIWYVVIVARYFDPSPAIWLSAAGIATVVGYSLYINAASAGRDSVTLNRWQIVRFFMTPFCVSSYSALIKGRDFLLLFPKNPIDIAFAVGSCAVFIAIICFCRAYLNPKSQ